MGRLTQDFWAGTLFLALGSAFAWGATSYSLGRAGQPGPGSFPFALGVLIAGIGLVLTLKGITQRGATKAASFGDWRISFVVLLAVVLFGAALIPFGLIAAVATLVLVAKPAIGGLSWVSAPIVAVILAIGTSVLFIGLLHLPIPLWPQL